ncbi:MAG: CotH kinase family protein, partial [Opitutaceae bacterium]
MKLPLTPLVIVVAGLVSAMAPTSIAAPPRTPDELFSLGKVWEVRLEFPAGQWQALEPKGGGDGPFGGRGGFNPNRFMAPVWLRALDANHDASVTRDEFEGAFSRWFTEWDKDKKGHLDTDALREGLNGALAMNPAGPGGPGGPGGRPGGPGGGRFGPNLLAKEGARNGLSGAAGIVFEYVHADLRIDGHPLTNVAVRYKGNGTYMGSRMSDKKSLKIDLNEFVRGQQVAGVAKLNLHNNVTDASWMNEPLSYRLYRDAGVPAPRTSYARVRVTAPGVRTNDYLGLYSIVENPDNRWAEARFGTKKGAIFKPVTPTLFQDLGDDWKAYQQIYDAKTDLTPKQRQRVIDFARLVTRAGDDEFARRAPEFLDVDAFGRFMAVTVWLSTLDSILTLGQNYVMYLHPKTDRFQFVPWDLDHSFGNFPMQGSQEQR